MGLIKRERRTTVKWPQPEDSVGKLLKTTASIQIWEAIGPARKPFCETLSEEIENYLAQCSDFVPLEVTWSLYMVGKSKTNSRPTVAFCNGEAQTRKRVMSIIPGSGILKSYPGFAVMECSKPPEWLALHYLGDPDADSHRIPASIGSKISPRIFVGSMLSIACSIHDEQAKFATAGAFLRHKTGHYLMTAAHVFKDCQAPIFSEIGPENDFTCSFDDDEEEDYDEEQFISITSIGSLSPSTFCNDPSPSDESLSTDLSLDSIEPLPKSHSPRTAQAPDIEPTTPVSHETRPNSGIHVLDSFSSSSLENISDSHSQALTSLRPSISSFDGPRKALDYVLIEVDAKAVHGPTPSHIKSRPGDKLSVANKVEGDFKILAYTATSGTLTGRLRGTPSFVLAAGAKQAQELWTVELDGCVTKGDSGSLIVDATSGVVYGHIVAGSLGTGFAYIVPMRDVLRDLEMRFKGTWDVQTSPTTFSSDQDTLCEGAISFEDASQGEHPENLLETATHDITLPGLLVSTKAGKAKLFEWIRDQLIQGLNRDGLTKDDKILITHNPWDVHTFARCVAAASALSLNRTLVRAPCFSYQPWDHKKGEKNNEKPIDVEAAMASKELQPHLKLKGGYSIERAKETMIWLQTEVDSPGFRFRCPLPEEPLNVKWTIICDDPDECEGLGPVKTPLALFHFTVLATDTGVNIVVSNRRPEGTLRRLLTEMC